MPNFLRIPLDSITLSVMPIENDFRRNFLLFDVESVENMDLTYWRSGGNKVLLMRVMSSSINFSIMWNFMQNLNLLLHLILVLTNGLCLA